MICKLDIVVDKKAGRSYLKDVFVTPPFRVIPVGQYHTDQAAYLMVMSSSPGILSGDEYQINVQVKENARLQLQSQSYQRLYNMDGKASQQMKVSLENGSAFFYVPHPVVPHTNAAFSSTNRVYLKDNCEVLMSEIITCGRKHHGEEFKYRYFQNLMEVYHHDRLILKDNVLLDPVNMPLGTIGLLEGYTHQGTLVYVRTKPAAVTEDIEYFFTQLSEENNVTFGISAMEHNGFVLRMLGNGGEQLYNCFQKIQDYLWKTYK